MVTSWNEARAERCRKLWDDGWSAARIAADLGGVTRNAVLSKVHRSGWAMRSTGHNRSLVPKQRKSRARSPTTSNSKASAARRFQGGDVAGTQPTPQDALVVVDGGLGKSFMDLEPGDCRFPIGEPGAPDFYFCAGQQTDGSYCLGHARIAYQHHQARRS